MKFPCDLSGALDWQVDGKMHNCMNSLWFWRFQAIYTTFQWLGRNHGGQEGNQ